MFAQPLYLLRQHAQQTGRVVSAMNPEYLSMLTLMLIPGTELHRQWQDGRFELPVASKGERSVDVWLEPGTHELVIFAAADGAQPLTVNRVRAVASDRVITPGPFAAADFDLTQPAAQKAAVVRRPAIVVANEFFDALPIRQFQRLDAFWRERLVGVEPGRLVAASDARTRLG